MPKAGPPELRRRCCLHEDVGGAPACAAEGAAAADAGAAEAVPAATRGQAVSIAALLALPSAGPSMGRARNEPRWT